MANEEQLSILRQGAKAWNKWRDENHGVKIDLSNAILRESDLSHVDLERANLQSADLSQTNLIKAYLLGANLYRANISDAVLVDATLAGADLREANLDNAHLRDTKLVSANLANATLNQASIISSDLSEATLAGADIIGARLTGCKLVQANLIDADLAKSILTSVNLWAAQLSRSNFAGITLQWCNFGVNDLSEVKGLNEVVHLDISSISTDTFAVSKGKIPDGFLRGCGLSDWEIEAVKLYNPELMNDERNKILYRIYDLQASQPIQISPLFISYSHADIEFVSKLEDCLQNRGIRYWRDIHEMKAGRIETQIDRGIRQNPTVLLILSEHSLESDWVEHEVRTARGLEKAMGRDVLCPVALDESWKNSFWPKRIMEQIMEYNILDFSEWKDDRKFGNTFNKLIDGLRLFYK